MTQGTANRVGQGAAKGNAMIPFHLPPHDTGKPRCLWCRDEFTPIKPNQLYCSRYHSKRACEVRRERLIDALAFHFAVYGLRRHHIEGCAEVWLKRCQTVAECLGYVYDERARVWKLEVQP